MASDTPLTQIESVGDGVLLVRGDLSFSSVTRVLAQSRPLLSQGSGKLALDLGEVQRADSAGLALLMQWLRMGKEQGLEIRFRHLPEQLLAIARASDLERLIPLEG